MLERLAAWKRQRSKALFAVLLGGSVLMVGYLPSTIGPSTGAGPAPSPAAHGPLSTSPFASAAAVVGVLEDCSSCHNLESDPITTRPFPAIPHEVKGWEECSFCHSSRRLAPAPASHAGLPDALCQACHKASQTPPPSLGHVLWQDKACSSCHRTTLAGQAPAAGTVALVLPATHDDRGEVTCVLCHKPAAKAPPAVPHPVDGGELCSGCHTADLLTAKSPRHMDWGEGLCVTCHDSLQAVRPPAVPHALDGRSDCAFCHRPAPAGRSPGFQAD